MAAVLFLLVLFPSLVLCQVVPAQNGQSTCAQAGRNAVAQCFQSNGGFQMTNVISLLSNRTQRPLSLNADQMRKNICQNQSEIITCMLNSITSLQSTHQCLAQNDFIRLEKETVGLINRIQTTCGSSQVLCTSLAGCQVIATQDRQTQATCAQIGRNAVTMCFQSNGGLKMQNVITLLSNGSQGTLPPVANQLRENMCSNWPNITTCVLSSINDIRESQRCPSTKDFVRLEQEAAGLTEGIRKICEGQVLASSTSRPCLPDLNDEIRNCFSKVGLNPDLYESNETKLIDAIIGENEEMAYTFCSNQQNITTCVLSSINDLRESQRCPSTKDFVLLEQEATGLIDGIGKICERQVLTSSTSRPCLPDLNDAMRNCFSKVGLNPDLSSSNETKLIDAIIGENEEMAYTFCRNRPRLFECLKTTMDDCPKAQDTMASKGFDHNSMEKSTYILCHDVDIYIKGLNCFRNITPQIDFCPDSTQDQGTNLTDRQPQMPRTEGIFFQELCMKRIQKLECRLRVWRDQCEEPNSVNLKNEIECALLPVRCLKESSIQSRLQYTCAMTNFARDLRSGATSSILTSGNLLIVILWSIVFFL